MKGSSSKSPMDTNTSKDYQDWSKKMKERLISEGLWGCVKEGYKKPTNIKEMSVAEVEEFKQETIKNGKALSLIHQSLPPFIFVQIVNATTAKEAWDTLYSMFLAFKEMQEKEDESIAEFMKSSNRSDEDGVMPLSGNKPVFDMVLNESALYPIYYMEFPEKVNSMLPQGNMVIKVRFLGEVHEIYYYGRSNPKRLGIGWKQLVEENDMAVGDILMFEIIESSATKLEMNMQIVKPTIPPKMDEEMKKKGVSSKHAINIDDDDDKDKE